MDGETGMTQASSITIMGREFVLRGDHDRAYLQRVETYLNSMIEQVGAGAGTIDSYKLVVLVALNLADEYLKKSDQLSQLEAAVEQESERLVNLIDSCL